MRRMQVVVEEWQYEFLRKMAESQGKSISAVLRQIISGRMWRVLKKQPQLYSSSTPGRRPYSFPARRSK